MANALANSHDFRLSSIDGQEDVLVTGLAKDLEQTVSNLVNEEILRNRRTVCEILAYKERVLHEIEQAEDSLK